MLQGKVIGIYCLIHDIFKGIGHPEHKERKISDSEVINIAVVSALYFKGNQHHAISYIRSHAGNDGKSGFCKRPHKLSSLLLWIFLDIGRMFKYVYAELEYIIDSFPLKVCHNIRISRSKILQGPQWRGYNASKKVQLVTTKDGIPVEMCFVPGSEHDVEALRKLYFDLPLKAVNGDSAYTEYEVEDLFKETELIELKINRKSNSKGPDKPYQAFIKNAMRKRIETTISEIIEMTPHSIHAVTKKDSYLKYCCSFSLIRLKQLFKTGNLG
jgi:hypothetical protein